ncbi:hypothetical protein M316_0043 [Nitrincola phage 1M3-16]|uniref:hypothetical protein n=1 Tax=Nitrincola phage 1M3-16 TaxID=1472912 RepID=UPI000444DA0C|nr:hypothetical protein GJ22_gp109 [Nitrincola phage 1M3-16]AHX01108.1 hypothetical protein M316_0043 [Nitrincola phage 1M3-16]
MLLKIVMDGSVKDFVDSLENLSNSPTGVDILLTTAHKSKGREWSQVILADDFAIPESITWEDMPPQEVNLFYVATTRAIDVLQMPSKIIDMNIYWGD